MFGNRLHAFAGIVVIALNFTGCGGGKSASPEVGYVLSVAVTGSGSVSSSPSGINCGASCSQSYESGTAITLTAVPASNHHLTAWGGACSGSGSTCTLSLTAALNVSASFVPNSAASDTQAPTAPANLAAVAVNAGQVNLTWTAATDNIGIDHYSVLRDGVVVGSVAALQYSDTVSAATTYSYALKAFDAAGNMSASSNAVSITTPIQASRSCPPAPAYPDANCTGFPPGTGLKVMIGNKDIDTPGTVIDGEDIRGCVVVSAPGVVIKNSKITCPGFASILTSGAAYSGTPLLIQDSEVTCLDSNGKATSGTAIGDRNFIALRLNVHGCENGFDVDRDAVIEDSYVHDLYQSPEAHTDGLQSADGSNVTINHNRIYAETPGACSPTGGDCGGTSAININNCDPTRRSGCPTTTNAVVSNNLLAGGASALYCPFLSNNVKVLNNRFSRLFFGPSNPVAPIGTFPTKGDVGAYGPSSDCLNDNGTPFMSQWIGNVYDASGLPIGPWPAGQ
jgi:hypothetical protein